MSGMRHAVTQRSFDLIPLIRVYDLPGRASGSSASDASESSASRHRAMWGKSCTDVFVLDDNHVLLVFSSKGPRWERWERTRLAWILADAAELSDALAGAA
jgi:hypothetical protein